MEAVGFAVAVDIAKTVIGRVLNAAKWTYDRLQLVRIPII
jgi:hypothetical protein